MSPALSLHCNVEDSALVWNENTPDAVAAGGASGCSSHGGAGGAGAPLAGRIQRTGTAEQTCPVQHRVSTQLLVPAPTAGTAKVAINITGTGPSGCSNCDTRHHIFIVKGRLHVCRLRRAEHCMTRRPWTAPRRLAPAATQAAAPAPPCWSAPRWSHPSRNQN